MQQAEVGTMDPGGGAGREESGRNVGTMEKGPRYEGKTKPLVQRRKEDVGTKEKEDVGAKDKGRRWYNRRWKRKTLH